MKKVFLALAIILVSLTSCESSNTSSAEDIMYLQAKYPTSLVYQLNGCDHLIIDSVHVYKVSMTPDGQIKVIIKIK